jgi:UPF0755 protein
MSRQRLIKKYTDRHNDRSYRGQSKRKKALFIVFIFSIMLGITSMYIVTRLDMSPLAFYSNMANPNMRYVTIPAGLRKEEIADRFAKALPWSKDDIQMFIETGPIDSQRGILDGYFLPGSYWVNLTDKGDDVALMMMRNFNKTFSENIEKLKKTQKNSGKSDKINIDTAVRIASLIQKEAAGSRDAKIISGVIWNRIFSGMTLDIDATLQYAKGTPGNWWPKPKSEDKRIDSPFNTYKNKGLPPTAISNPSWTMIEAALNPTQTDCIFYIHDAYRRFHCAKTYEVHKQNINKYLIGQNKQ